MGKGLAGAIRFHFVYSLRCYCSASRLLSLVLIANLVTVALPTNNCDRNSAVAGPVQAVSGHGKLENKSDQCGVLPRVSDLNGTAVTDSTRFFSFSVFLTDTCNCRQSIHTKKAFCRRAVAQRCVWHNLKYVVAYLPKGDQAEWRRRFQRAYGRPTYREALAELVATKRDLLLENRSAAASLIEGLEETLTLHRLSAYGALGRSFKTTNCLESVNVVVEQRCAKVDVRENSNQRDRWLWAALVDSEPVL